MSLYPPGISKFKVISSQPGLALLTLLAQTGIPGGHPADKASLRLGKTQQAGLKCQKSDLHNKLLGAGFHLCKFLGLQCHQWHCKSGAITVTTSERGQNVTSALKTTSCAHWRNGHWGWALKGWQQENTLSHSLITLCCNALPCSLTCWVVSDVHREQMASASSEVFFFSCRSCAAWIKGSKVCAAPLCCRFFPRSHSSSWLMLNLDKQPRQDVSWEIRSSIFQTPLWGPRYVAVLMLCGFSWCIFVIHVARDNQAKLNTQQLRAKYTLQVLYK